MCTPSIGVRYHVIIDTTDAIIGKMFDALSVSVFRMSNSRRLKLSISQIEMEYILKRNYS